MRSYTTPNLFSINFKGSCFFFFCSTRPYLKMTTESTQSPEPINSIEKPSEVNVHSQNYLDQLHAIPREESDVELTKGAVPDELDRALEKYKPEIVELTAQNDENIEEPKLLAEYRIWKKNAVYLYDLMISTRLTWPSLTVQWYPDIEQVDGGRLKRHKLLLGTQTSGQSKEFLRIVSIDLPEETLSNGERIVPNLSKYDAEKGEIGGYMNQSHSKAHITQFIDHEGEVNSAKYMPQNPNIVASASSTGKCFIYDTTKHPLQARGYPRPDMVLVHHTDEASSLSWNPTKKDILATGSNDSTVALWNLRNYRKNKHLTPQKVIRTHTDLVNDVAFHPTHGDILGSASEDKTIHIHDIRLSDVENTAALSSNPVTSAINTLSFNPSNTHLLATGCVDGTIDLWDFRNMQSSLHTFAGGHTESINSISWNPHFETILASASSDRRVMIWDASRIEDNVHEEGTPPPELLFVHGGHTEAVSSVDWSPYLPWTLGSVSNENQLHIFRPADTIVGQSR